MADSLVTQGNVRSVPPDVQRAAVEHYAKSGSFTATGDALGMHHEVVRRIVKSPAGSYALEQTLRENARTRALKLGALTDRLINELDETLVKGNERILNGRRDDDPLTVFLRPDVRDLTNALAWITHHVREISESLATIDVTSHDVSHEARSQNLATLKELVATEERRLQLDGERAAEPVAADQNGAAQNMPSTADVTPAVDSIRGTPWARPSWGGPIQRSLAQRVHSAKQHAKARDDADAASADASLPLASRRSGDSGAQSLSESAGAAAPPSSGNSAALSSNDAGPPPSHDRPPPVPPAGDTGLETPPPSSESAVTWEDLE